MTNADYAQFVDENAKFDLDLNYAVIAINGEAGEIAEWYKKAVLRGNPGGLLSQEDLKLEVGDLYYYIVRLCNLCGWTIDDIAQANVDKLVARAKEQK